MRSKREEREEYRITRRMASNLRAERRVVTKIPSRKATRNYLNQGEFDAQD